MMVNQNKRLVFLNWSNVLRPIYLRSWILR